MLLTQDTRDLNFVDTIDNFAMEFILFDVNQRKLHIKVTHCGCYELYFVFFLFSTMWRTIVLLCKQAPTTAKAGPLYIPSRQEVVHLYRNLLKGRRTFEYTDKNYYTKRIRNEFKQNVALRDKEVLSKAFEVRLLFHVRILFDQDGKRMLDTKYGGVI